MPRIALTGGAYQARSVIASAQRSLNLFAEPLPQQTGEPSQFAHYPTPGLSLLGTLPQPHIRGIRQVTTGGIYAVAGNAVYRVDPVNWTGTWLGAITGGLHTPVSMADNGNTLVVVDGSAGGWTVDLASDAINPISSDGFYGADRVDYLDTFFVFNKPNTPQFYWSGSLATTFDPTDFINKEGFSDLLVTIAVAKLEIWLLGQRTTEIYYDAGQQSTADLQFQRQPGVFVDYGCLAKYSVATYNDAVYWLGCNRAGQGIVLVGENYQARRISTYAIEAHLAAKEFTWLTDAIGFVYSLGGHAFYVLTFPGLDETWVYDITTAQWHEWKWLDSNGVEHRHRANCAAYVGDWVVVGDWENGNLYRVDPLVYTDNGQPIKRQRSYPHIINEMDRVFYRQFIADIESGNPPQEIETVIETPPAGPSGYYALPQASGGIAAEPYAISADGRTAVGYCCPAGQADNAFNIACYWTVPSEPSGPELSVVGTGPFLITNPDPAVGEYGTAYGVSGDGNIIVGYAQRAHPGVDPFNANQAFVYFRDTNTLTWFGSQGRANGISKDGTVIVGWQAVNPTAPGYQGSKAVWWDTATLTQHDIGWLPGHLSSVANACSADGSVITGTSSPNIHEDGTAIAGSRAFRWTAASGIQDLGSLPSPDFPGSEAFTGRSVSDDGAVIAGGQFSNINVGYIWTSTTGMVSTPIGCPNSNGMSGDATTIVGTSGDGIAVYYPSDGSQVNIPLPPGVAPAHGIYANNTDETGNIVVGAETGGPTRVPIVCYIQQPTPPGPTTFTSSGRLIWLDWSDDRGHSFGNPVSQTIGARGAYLTVCQWQRLGYARDRVFRITFSVPVSTALQGAFIEIDASPKS